ncbi:MAG: hypothetical protein IKO16_00795 [Lachnospiraceae bacterium]|nr:hypothetical protein [Lachnospiraceae bacterium]
MELTDVAKNKLKNADSKEEVQNIFQDIKNGTKAAGVLLSDDDLDQVSGGAWFGQIPERER